MGNVFERTAKEAFRRPIRAAGTLLALGSAALIANSVDSHFQNRASRSHKQEEAAHYAELRQKRAGETQLQYDEWNTAELDSELVNEDS
jgi:hypothetical protein